MKKDICKIDNTNETNHSFKIDDDTISYNRMIETGNAIKLQQMVVDLNNILFPPNHDLMHEQDEQNLSIAYQTPEIMSREVLSSLDLHMQQRNGSKDCICSPCVIM